MHDLDLNFVRRQFPAFSDASLGAWCHFENAGGSYACGQVVNRLQHFYVANKVQPYYYADASIEGGRQMDQARNRFAASLNVRPDELHFGPSTTQNTYVLAQALRRHLQDGDEIVVTNLDHEANIGPWRRLVEDGVVIREWCIDMDTGELELDDLDALLNERTRVVAFSHCSNIVGSITPVREIVERVHAAGAWAIVDGVSYCGHGLPDVAALGADVYLFSLYKVYGPHLGVMVMRRAVNESLPNQGHFFNDDKPTARFTPAGPDHAQIAVANGVIDYFEAVYRHHGGSGGDAVEIAATVRQCFQKHERELLQPLLDYLVGKPGVRLLGRRQAEARAPTVAVQLAGRDPHDLARGLAQDRIFAGAGDFYAPRCLQGLGIDDPQGVLRLSFVHYTAKADIERLLTGLDRLLAN